MTSYTAFHFESFQRHDVIHCIPCRKFSKTWRHTLDYTENMTLHSMLKVFEDMTSYTAFRVEGFRRHDVIRCPYKENMTLHSVAKVFEDMTSYIALQHLDDLMQEMKSDKKLVQLFTKGSHHWNLSFFCILSRIYFSMAYEHHVWMLSI